MNTAKYLMLKAFYKMNPDQKLFCPIPFKYLEVGADTTYLCCHLKKSAGVPDGDFMNLYNGPDAQKIRESILDGTFRYCDMDGCPHYTAGDLPLQKDCIGTPYEEIITKKQTFLTKKSLWLSFDARCNLKCFSCRKDYYNATPEQINDVEKKMKIVKKYLPTLENLALTGNGDPFSSPIIRKFLFELNVAEYPNLKITLLTNGLLFNEKAWESMAGCRSAVKSVQVSCDAATKENYEKIRLGGSYENLIKSLRFISSLRKSKQIGEFIISMVVNAMNYVEMKNFVELGIDLGCDQIYFSRIGNWGTMKDDAYKALAVHLAGHKLHQDFRKTLENPIFNHPTVFLGNIKRFQNKRILRDSLFS